jgi:phenylacetate-CoA ligase
MAFIPEIEQQPLDVQAVFQSQKLKILLSYLQEHSVFYRKLFEEHGIAIEKITSVNDLPAIPTTSKEDLQLYNDDFLCVPQQEIREYTATSGTLGKPVIIALTENDLQRLAYNEYLSFNCLGAVPGDVFQLMLTLDRQFMAGMAYYSGIGKLGAAAIRTGPGLPAMQWETIQRLKTTGLVGVPSFLMKMISHAQQHNIPLAQGTVTKVLAIGESLRDEALQPNALAKMITDQWNIKLYSTYASTEMQTAFTECSEGRGGHHHPELIIIEVIDDEGNPVTSGATGEVAITTLGVEAMPLLRYRTGDMCRAYYDTCACGRNTLRLGPVLGRKKQMIKLKGTTLYPPLVFDLLNEISAIKEYVVTVSSSTEGQDILDIYLYALASPELEELLKTACRHRLRVMPRIIYSSEAEIRHMQYPEGSRKPLRFIDLRQQLSL